MQIFSVYYQTVISLEHNQTTAIIGMFFALSTSS